MIKKNGFSLVELLIATAIAATLSLILFQAFTQMNHGARSLDTTMDLYSRAILVTHQMEKDLSGTFVPLQAQKDQKSDQKTTPEQEKTTSAENGKKELTHLFYSTNKENNLNLLTFITNNPLQVYWSNSSGGAKPRIARVVYRLKAQPLPKGWRHPSYMLTRQESYQLNFELFTTETNKIKEFEVINGIKQLTCTYFSAPEQSDKEASSSTSPSTGPIDYKKTTEWDKDQKALVPHLVEVTIVLWNNQQRSDKTFVFTVPIYPDIQYASSFTQTTTAQWQQSLPAKTTMITTTTAPEPTELEIVLNQAGLTMLQTTTPQPLELKEHA